jgi:hypothetical protein
MVGTVLDGDVENVAIKETEAGNNHNSATTIHPDAE